MYH
ncbi:hypothetical protein YPPY12_4638, partial [Yersinia pestis PY-12]|jgi:uncharacterized protein with GYD domain